MPETASIQLEVAPVNAKPESVPAFEFVLLVAVVNPALLAPALP